MSVLGNRDDSVALKEIPIRILLDVILFHLCRKAKCEIEVGTTVESKQFGTRRFDYRITYKGFAIGCVETKRTDGLSTESIVQALLQLCVLQAEVAEKGYSIQLLPLFSILTNGTQYILIKLEKNAKKDTELFVFENYSGKLRVHEFCRIEDIVNWFTPILILTKKKKKCFNSFVSTFTEKEKDQ
ncbi:hypothetical protein FSP39_023718 [Pinctada imbricata]|uniref:Uncharacterized protein n=1 Tax=Pinctada imbricata TaxID=66713 RepID=A0AA89CC75_PINIB|nr:hypothetical protein FSP39_023718 [Pinctada imbricata]